jgi:hypothetical protein
MAMPYEQATETYLMQALAHPHGVSIDSPNRERSHLSKGVWHLRNMEGNLIAKVGAGSVRLPAA